MGNRLNKPYMEVEGNQTTRNTIIQPEIEENCHFLGGEGKRDGGGQN